MNADSLGIDKNIYVHNIDDQYTQTMTTTNNNAINNNNNTNNVIVHPLS